MKKIQNSQQELDGLAAYCNREVVMFNPLGMYDAFNN